MAGYGWPNPSTDVPDRVRLAFACTFELIRKGTEMSTRPDLRIDLEQLNTAAKTAGRVRHDLEATSHDYQSLVESVGHSRLGRVVAGFSSSWSIHRKHLLSDVQTLCCSIEAARDDFQAVDKAAAGGSEGPSPVGGSPAGSHPAPNLSSTSSALPAAPSAGSVHLDTSPNPPAVPVSGGQPLPGGPAPQSTTLRAPDPGEGAQFPQAPDLLPPSDPAEPADPFADVREDAPHFQSLLGHWAAEAIRLQNLGLPLAALGAGTLAVLQQYGKLPPALSLQPDGTINKGGSSLPSTPGAASASQLLDSIGPAGERGTRASVPTQEGSEPVADDRVGSDVDPDSAAPGEAPITPEADTAEDDTLVGAGDAQRSGSIDSALSVPEDGAGVRPNGFEVAPGAASEGSGSAQADASSVSQPSAGQGSSGASETSGGLPLPPPPSSSAAERLLDIGTSSTGGVAVAGTAAVAAAALSGVSGSPGGGISAPAAQANASTQVAAMGSLAAMTPSLGASGGVSGAGGVAGVPAPGMPLGPGFARGEGNERLRAAKEALDRLAQDQDNNKRQESDQ